LSLVSPSNKLGNARLLHSWQKEHTHPNSINSFFMHWWKGWLYGIRRISTRGRGRLLERII
jgi:hypothetical protein